MNLFLWHTRQERIKCKYPIVNLILALKLRFSASFSLSHVTFPNNNPLTNCVTYSILCGTILRIISEEL